MQYPGLGLPGGTYPQLNNNCRDSHEKGEHSESLEHNGKVCRLYMRCVSRESLTAEDVG